MADDQYELQFNIGEDEEEATVMMDQDGSKAADVQKEELVVEQANRQDAPDSEDLDQYSEKVKKRIDKLTARLREHQRREEAAIEYARSVQKSNEELQQRYSSSIEVTSSAVPSIITTSSSSGRESRISRIFASWSSFSTITTLEPECSSTYLHSAGELVW